LDKVFLACLNLSSAILLFLIKARSLRFNKCLIGIQQIKVKKKTRANKEEIIYDNGRKFPEFKEILSQEIKMA